MRRVSCGVLITDGGRLLLGHATRSPRWDIPKGLVEPGETPLVAAVRELREETGLLADAEALRPLGVHRYLPGKDLTLFAWSPATLPDPGSLVCSSMVCPPGGGAFPELDRFELVGWDAALTMVGRNLARVLTDVRPLADPQIPALPPPG